MGVNKAILIGNLGKDPELKYTPGGQAVASFTLATGENYTDKAGQRQKRTEWHNIVAWNKLAELAGQYLKKGRSVYIEGRITNRQWDDRDGKKHYRTEIIAGVIQFLDGGRDAQGNGGSGSGGGTVDRSAPSDNDAPPAFEEPAMGSQQPAEDDLPF